MKRVILALMVVPFIGGCLQGAPEATDRDALGRDGATSQSWHPSWASPEVADIRPGIAIRFAAFEPAPELVCTLTFLAIHDATRKALVGTAQHCADGQQTARSERILADGVGEFATLVHEDVGRDQALYLMDDDVVARSNPQVVGLEAPKGLTDCGAAVPGDGVTYFGAPWVLRHTPLGDGPRDGQLTRCDSGSFETDIRGSYGDSGGALFDAQGYLLGMGQTVDGVAEGSVLRGQTIAPFLASLAGTPWNGTRLALLDGTF